MAQQVTITLTASLDHFGQRTLKLTPKSTSIPIGRSSKSANKNILGAVNNAWFDSPVMSRKHAEMSLKIDNGNSVSAPHMYHSCDYANTLPTVTIRDIGSMHGTCVNGRKLLGAEEAQIHDRDVVEFGAEVKRGLEVFPACSFQVGLEFAVFHSSNSYCSPEMDDSSEACISDVETDEREQVSSEDGISIESPVQYYKGFDSSQAIDLTEDDSPAPAPSSDIVDLTNEPAPATETVSRSSVMGLLPGYAIQLSDSDDQSEMEDLGDSEVSENSYNSDEPQDIREMDDDIINDSASEDMDIADEVSEFDDDDLPANVREINQRIALLNELEVAMDEDDESDFGLSDSGAEELRALFKNEPVAPEGSTTNPSHLTTAARLDDATSTAISPKAFQASALSAAASMDEFSCEPLTSTRAAGSLYQRPNGETLPVRQPSPSDAAMVKAAPVKFDQQSITHYQGYSASQMPQTLGDKTGKHAFFEAREKNKANASAAIEEKAENNAETSGPQQKPLFADIGPRTIIPLPIVANRSPVITPKWAAEAFTHSLNENQAQFCSELFCEGHNANPLSLLEAPSKSFSLLDQVPLVHCSSLRRATSPDYDMTSAHQFNESKNKAVRSRLSIHDIIENSAGEQSIPAVETRVGGKRKADEISDIQDEVRAWASLAVAQGKSTTPTQASVLASSSTIESRPTKKLKKFMEAAAYVAVGGVTVGAGLFFSLVATAPNFT